MADGDILFTNFKFPALGEPTPRTMPDRLSEVKNVKDFGAKGNGTDIDSDAIQDAVDWTTGPNRGTIYFPIGIYQINRPITLDYDGDLSICLRGDVGTVIRGNVNGFMIDRHPTTPNNTPGIRVIERFNFQQQNLASGGCIRIGSSIGAVIRECSFLGYIDITTEDTPGVSSENVYIENCSFQGPGTTGSHFVIIGGGGAIQACDLNAGADVAVRAYGSGLHIAGNRCERNNTGFLLGLDSGDNDVGLSGFSIMSGSCEGNITSFDLKGTCSGFTIGGYLIQGHDITNGGPPGNPGNSQYGIRIHANKAKCGSINSMTIGSWFDNVAFSIEDATSRTNLVISDINASVGGGTGVNWAVPGNAYTAKFENCNIYPLWTFAQLPTGGDVLEGDEFDITNSSTIGWGDTVSAGSPGNHCRVRYNGSVWTVVGK